ncbi:MAG: FixH family protein [Saccharospirillaceae bacterium]|jgi:hypothetical protein|nr:hypothetical protein A3759_07735 [Thalassolituus sp. HI0120]MCH2040158.1 FixH family protein [Saccharospirillaceae bacterium]
MKPENQERITRWYQEPYMLLVIGIPIVAVMWGVVMLSAALSGKDSLVSDSYYKDGMAYTQDHEADEKAKRLQVSGNAVFTADEVRVIIDGYLDDFPHTLRMTLIHPTLEDQDQVLLLQKMADGSYAGVNDMNLPGKRRIWLDSLDQGWRIRAHPFIEAGKDIALSSK